MITVIIKIMIIVIMPKKLVLGEQEKEVIRLMGAGVLLTISIAAPNLPVALKPFLRSKQNRYQFKKRIQKMKEKDLIFLSGEVIKLSENGKKLLAKIDSEDIEIKKSNWDGSWRVVAYDIPDKHKKERNYFRRKLIALGFKQVQESMLVIPYECKEEISIFANQIGVSPFVIYLITDKLPKQEAMVEYFGLQEQK